MQDNDSPFAAVVAQLDRARAYEARGCRFDPCRLHLSQPSMNAMIASPVVGTAVIGGEGPQESHSRNPLHGSQVKLLEPLIAVYALLHPPAAT